MSTECVQLFCHLLHFLYILALQYLSSVFSYSYYLQNHQCYILGYTKKYTKVLIGIANFLKVQEKLSTSYSYSTYI